VLLAGVAAFALLVGGTAAFALRSAEDEQEHRDELIAAGELPSPEDAQQELIDAANEARNEAQDEAPAPNEEVPGTGGTETASVDAAAVFEEQGCAGCHTLEAAGSQGSIGPDLDATLVGEDGAYIEESIIDPSAEIEEGFGPSMPTDFAQRLTPEELDALVQYIADSAGIKG